MGTDMGDILTDHNNVAIPTAARAAAISEGTHCIPHPATAVACTAPWPIDAPTVTHARTHPTSMVVLNPTLTTSLTHATTPWTRTSLAPATLTTLHRKYS